MAEHPTYTSQLPSSAYTSSSPSLSSYSSFSPPYSSSSSSSYATQLCESDDYSSQANISKTYQSQLPASAYVDSMAYDHQHDSSSSNYNNSYNDSSFSSFPSQLSSTGGRKRAVIVGINYCLDPVYKLKYVGFPLFFIKN